LPRINSRSEFIRGGFAAIKASKKRCWKTHHGNRSIAFGDATKIKCVMVFRARKGAAFSLNSKENKQ
jgi:hypothetical protein